MENVNETHAAVDRSELPPPSEPGSDSLLTVDVAAIAPARVAAHDEAEPDSSDY